MERTKNVVKGLTSTQEIFDLGVQHLMAGQTSEAEFQFQQIIDTEPEHAVALNLLGVIKHQTGMLEVALDFISRALAANPGYAEAYFNLGLVYHDQGRLDDAVQSYQTALHLKVEYPEAQFNLGTVFQDQSNFEKAIDCYQKVISVKPDLSEAHYKLGNILDKMGHFGKAEASFNNAISLNPNYTDAYLNLGQTLKKQKKLQESAAIYEKILRVDPELSEAHNNLGNTLQDLGRPEDAIVSFNRALTLRPDYSEAHNNLGIVFKYLGKFDEALESYRRAISLWPNYAEAHNNLGVTLQAQEKPGEAIKSFERAIAIRPNYADAYNNLANVVQTLAKIDEASAHYLKAISLKPDFALAYDNLALNEQYQPNATLESIRLIHARWEGQFGVPLQSEWREHKTVADPNKKLRVGFVSSDLGRHPVGYFAINLFENRDKNTVQFLCYSDRHPDDLTERFKNLSDEWTDTRGLSDEALSRRIRSDKIDILIDLAGHTAKNRLLVFARKPAPIQIAWLGYAASTGLFAMDYMIADSRHITAEFEDYYSEKIIRLPDGWVCFEPPDYAPDVNLPPFEQNSFVTFGGFHNPAKLNQTVLSAWAKILKAVPRSRLILKYGGIEAEANRNRIFNQFNAEGVDPLRLTLEGHSSHDKLLERYHDVDIALDTFPYSGGLTTCESVWMGVPVISLSGEIFSSRHTLSHLTSIGVPELVSNNWEDYVNKAVDLAMNGSRLSGLRSSLRPQMAKSSLCDGEKFSFNFSSALRDAWQEWCRARNVNNSASAD